MDKALRFIIIVVVIVTFLNAVVFFGMGIFYSLEAYFHLVTDIKTSRPGIFMLESIDRFFIGFIFIIFSIGLSKLFLPESKFFGRITLPWLRIENFYQLKMVLWSTILTAMFVGWVVDIVDKDIHLVWQDALLPGSILVLGIAARFVKQIHQE